MPRSPFLVLAVAGCLACTAHAGEVYQWKDANGVTHYAQTPPPKGSYQQRQITTRGASTPMQATAPVESAEVDPQCAAARGNVTALAGDGPVHHANSDGQPGRALNDAERVAQLELAQAAVKAYCRTSSD